MTKTIVVTRGLCSPMRHDVLTALKPFGVKILAFDCWGEGHYHLPVPPSMRMPDSDIWVRKHIAHITVSDAQQRWVEWLLWQSNKVWLASEPHPANRSLVWTAPKDCKAGAHGTLGRGTMPTPWSAQPKRERRTRRTRRQTRRQTRRNEGGIMDAIRRVLRAGR